MSQSNSPYTVIITRPSPYGEALCTALDEQGFYSIHKPLITFEQDWQFDATQRFEQLSQASTWIFVSRQAVTYCFDSFKQKQLQDLLKLSTEKMVIAVGAATADSLQQLDFKPLIPPTPNSEGMIQLLDTYQRKQYPALLIRGNKGRELLEQYFDNGNLSFLPVYQRLPTNNTLPPLASNANTAIVVTSGQLMELVAEHYTDDPERLTIIAGSGRINKMAQHMGFTNCYTAKDASNLELVKTCILWRNNIN